MTLYVACITVRRDQESAETARLLCVARKLSDVSPHPLTVVTSAAAAAPAMIPPPGPMMTPMSMPPPQQETDHDSSRGNGPISMSAAAAPTAADGASDAASAAPQFFNPNQFAGAAPVGATKRNKYH